MDSFLHFLGTSSGAADSSIVWRIKRYTTGRNDLAALGSDTHYTSVTPLSLGSGALRVPLLTAESNDNLFDDWRAYGRVLSGREIAKLAGLRVNKGFILGVR